jgi:flagellar protein FlaG
VDKEAQLEQLKLAIENYTRLSQPDIRVEIHQGTGQIMAKVVSSEDGRVIREIPPKEILDLQARIKRKVGGLLNRMA